MASPEPTTPSEGVQHNAPQITAQQKQKLIDDLQSELTLRARELRSRAAMKVQSISSTIENRIMTVPSKLRHITIGELLDEIGTSKDSAGVLAKANIVPPYKSSHAILGATQQDTVKLPKRNGTKRTSDEMIGSDKENQDANIDVPKKRTRVAAVPKSAADSKASRAASRKINPSQVLSPKSNNSRTLPHSPLKAQLTEGRYYGSRPASPAKSIHTMSTVTSTVAQTTEKPRAARQKAIASKSTISTTSTATRTKRVAATTSNPRVANNRIASDSSTTSTISTGTTIVTKKAAPSRKGVMSKVQGIASAASRKVAAVRKEAVASETGRRVLRSRK